MRSITRYLLLLAFGSNAADFLELETKQSIDNLRYVSTDGKVTYYQSRSGTLSFSTNYKNTKIIESSKKTQYNLHLSSSKKQVLVEKDDSFHSFMSFNKLKDIYVTKYGSKNADFLAKGVSAKLHLDDTYMSYFLPKAKKINVLNLKTKTTKAFDVLSSLTPYTRPIVEMLSSNEIIYSDSNSNAESALLNYSFVTKKVVPIFKSKFKSSGIDYCLMKDKIILFEKSQNRENQQTNIYIIETLGNENYKSFDLIYSSTLSDLGSLKCLGDEIFFIKSIDYNKQLNTFSTDVAKINIKSKVLKRFESKMNPTQLVLMDELILTTKSGKYFLVQGNNRKLTNDSIGKESK